MICPKKKKVKIIQAKYASDPKCEQWQAEIAIRLSWYREKYGKVKTNEIR